MLNSPSLLLLPMAMWMCCSHSPTTVHQQLHNTTFTSTCTQVQLPGLSHTAMDLYFIHTSATWSIPLQQLHASGGGCLIHQLYLCVCVYLHQQSHNLTPQGPQASSSNNPNPHHNHDDRLSHAQSQQTRRSTAVADSREV